MKEKKNQQTCIFIILRLILIPRILQHNIRMKAFQKREKKDFSIFQQSELPEISA